MVSVALSLPGKAHGSTAVGRTAGRTKSVQMPPRALHLLRRYSRRLHLYSCGGLNVKCLPDWSRAGGALWGSGRKLKKVELGWRK